MGLEIEGATQQAPQSARHSIRTSSGIAREITVRIVAAPAAGANRRLNKKTARLTIFY